MNAKVMSKGFFIFNTGEHFIGVCTKASGINLAKINMGLTINDPVGQFRTNATPHQKTAREALCKP